MQKEAINQNEFFNKDTGVCVLPHGIVVHNGGQKTLVKEFRLRELSGNEEDILSDNRRADGGKGKLLVSGSDRITNVLARCTLSFGDEEHAENVDPGTSNAKYFRNIWNRATSGDRSFALCCLRRMSVGDKYVFNHTCPECKAEIRKIEVDLSTLDVYPPYRDIKVTEELDKDAVNQLRQMRAVNDVHDVTLPSGKKASLKILRGTDEDRLFDELNANLNEQPTVNLMFRIETINGETATKQMIKNLPSGDRRYVNSILDDIEGGLDNQIEVKCGDCGHKFFTYIDFGKQSFFFPSGT